MQSSGSIDRSFAVWKVFTECRINPEREPDPEAYVRDKEIGDGPKVKCKAICVSFPAFSFNEGNNLFIPADLQRSALSRYGWVFEIAQ